MATTDDRNTALARRHSETGTETVTASQRPGREDHGNEREKRDWELKGRLWRVDVENRYLQLEGDVSTMKKSPPSDVDPASIEQARGRLDLVDNLLKNRSWRRDVTGFDVERAWVNLHAVEVLLLRSADPEDLRGHLDHVLGFSRTVLQADDPELANLLAIKERARSGSSPSRDDVRAAANALSSAYHASENQHRRVRSFRNILLAVAAACTLVAIALGIVGAIWPEAITVCSPRATVEVGSTTTTTSAVECPTGGDAPSGGNLATVELLGAVSAIIVGALAVRRMRGTSTPYSVPIASLLLKLPVGALTAVGGLILLNAGFMPAVSELSATQLTAYALVFGASQQAFTGFVDRQAQNVLDAVGVVDQDRAQPHPP